MPPELSVGIFLSDSVIREENTGKLSLIGGFQFFNSSTFPFQGQPFVVTVGLRNVPENRQFGIKVAVVDSKNLTLGRSEGQVLVSKIPHPDAIFEFPFPLPPIIFPEPGTYTIAVTVEGVEVGKRALIVRSVTSMN